MSFAAVLRAKCLLRAVIHSSFQTHYTENKGNAIALRTVLVREDFKTEMNTTRG